MAQADVYTGGGLARFASVRYGNVVGSRGSVIPIFKQQAAAGELTITDARMTRFWITLERAVEFVLSSMSLVEGGETFVPKIPSMRIVDLANALAPDAKVRVTGIRPGEKLHEVLLTEDEARQSYDLGDRYMIMPARPTREHDKRGQPLPDGFRYASDSNDDWLTTDELLEMTGGVAPARRAHDRSVAEPGWEAEEFVEEWSVRLMWCSRGCLGPHAISEACLWHVSIAGGADAPRMRRSRRTGILQRAP